MKNKLLSTITMAGLLLMSVQSFAQSPALGTAADFVLFSTVGAVGNTGLSHVTGNVGSNSGAITGFGNVNGVMNASNGATAQCAADLLIAYNLLHSAIPDFFPAPLLGNGQLLGAGVYAIAGPATLSNELTLDAQNDPEAVFIFKINGAFSTAALSSVTLINGAQACNVFWKVEGLVDMASGTTMRGTVIANNGAININADGVLEGRALSTSGAINVSGSLAYTPIGCGSPVLMGPDAPDLVSAGCYAIFSSSGPVANAGITYVVGDVGTNVGLTSGFNPLFVTGEVHPIPDGSTAAAAADLLNVYNYLNVLPYDIELLYPAQFGNDLVLTPHTYLLNAATSFSGDLYLNAGGQEDAVFVIQINGALTTSTYANVILMDGTKPENVFWKVDGAVAVNDYSNFVGTIIANNGAVEINTGVNLEGRAFSTTGAVSIASATITMPPGCICVPLYSSGKTDGDLISNVAISGTTLVNNSGMAQVNPAYSYFTGQPNYTADLMQGGSYNFTISIGTRGDQAVRVWIDYNDDGVFDETESIGSTTVAPGGGFSATGFPPSVFNVNLSINAPLGTHRMRVRSAFDEDAATLSPCAHYTYGETEDYDVTIVASMATQLQPGHCNATNVTMDTPLRAVNVNAPAYRFRVTGANNGGPGWMNNSFVFDSENRAMKFQFIPGSLWGEIYLIEVAVGDGFGNFGSFGDACNVSMLNNIPSTQLQAADCNSTNVDPNTNLLADKETSAKGYRFRVNGANVTGFVVEKIMGGGAMRKLKMNQVTGIVLGETYTVEVAIMDANGNWGAYGASCNVTLAGTPELVINDENEIFMADKSLVDVAFGANASQNPFITEFGIQVLNANDSETINVVIYDMSGKLIERNAVNPMDIEAVKFGSNLASGMYMIEVRQGSNQAVIRQVKN